MGVACALCSWLPYGDTGCWQRRHARVLCRESPCWLLRCNEWQEIWRRVIIGVIYCAAPRKAPSHISRATSLSPRTRWQRDDKWRACPPLPRLPGLACVWSQAVAARCQTACLPTFATPAWHCFCVVAGCCGKMFFLWTPPETELRFVALSDSMDWVSTTSVDRASTCQQGWALS